MNKVIEVSDDTLQFDSGYTLYSSHEQDCCESHYLDFSDLKIEDFDGLEFDLDGEFFERVEDFGIRLIPVNGHPVSVPGYGENNGYYSSELTLVLRKEGTKKIFDISERQVISG